ncbi:MAG: hypothetical protein GY842_23545 [bacterium]|nr:hypothetical protein [bacterium]
MRRSSTTEPVSGMRAPRWYGRTAPLLAALLLGATGPAAAQLTPEDGEPQRIVRLFDFDEPDNLGSIPKYWELFPGESFPHYAGGRFDQEVGRTTAPSFYLDSNGRNVAFRYRGIETRIRPNSDYLVAGWIRPNNLRTSRATITAYYLNHEGNPLPETQRQARLVGGPEAGDGWHRVEVLVPAGSFEADALGITLWVEQASVWDTTPRPEHHIERADVKAGAWFDDILVYRLPRVMLSAPTPGNCFVQPQTATLETTVLDHDGAGLSAELVVLDATGVIVARREVPVLAAAHRVDLPNLVPGHYRATLKVTSAAHVLVDRRIEFAVLSRLAGNPPPTVQAFGVVLGGARRGGSDAEANLITAAGLGAFKVPLWTGSASKPGFSEDTVALDGLLNGLLHRRMDVTGVLGGLPPELVHSDDVAERSLIDILNDPVESWRPFLGATVAPYASVLSSWQIGADGDRRTATHPRLTETLRAVRREMLTLMTSPYLTAPIPADVEAPDGELVANRLSLAMPRGVHPEQIGEHLVPFQQLGVARLEAYLELPSQAHARIPRLSKWAAQIIETRHAGADVVFVPQPWRWRTTTDGPTVGPIEEYVVCRTIVALLGDARPAGALTTPEGIRALIFNRGPEAVLAVWDRRAPPEGRGWDVQLGGATEVTDLWGRSTALERTDEGLHHLQLTPAPVLIGGIEPWVLNLQRDLQMLPASVTFTLTAHRHAIRLVNPGKGNLIGKLSLDAPPTWHIKPHNLEFNVALGGTSDAPVHIRYGSNEASGDKVLMADVHLTSPRKLHLRIPLRYRLDIDGVDVWGYAAIEGRRLLVRHGVRNRSGEVLSFRAYAAAPGHDRQYRSIIGLEPGATITREYRFDNAAALLGRKIRVGLREVNGSRIHNMVVEAP